MKRARVGIALLLMAALLLSGCALFGTKNVTVKSFADMNYMERAVYFQEQYNKQYDDAAAMGAMTNLAPAQVKIYNAKVELLAKVRPLIRAYRAIVIGGGVPSPSQEQEINNMLNQLLSSML